MLPVAGRLCPRQPAQARLISRLSVYWARSRPGWQTKTHSASKLSGAIISGRRDYVDTAAAMGRSSMEQMIGFALPLDPACGSQIGPAASGGPAVPAT
jgi:hypothetical protein